MVKKDKDGFPIGVPKKDSSGHGVRDNRGRGGCITTKKKGKGSNNNKKSEKNKSC